MFVEMDPEEVLKAIEGYENELEPAQKSLDAFYRQFRCPVCKSSCRKEISAGHTFSDPDSLVPRSILHCDSCNYTFDPHTGLCLSVGDTPFGDLVIPRGPK